MPRRSNITPPARTQAGSSMGYPRIEQLIDSEDFADVNEAFEITYAELSTLVSKSRSIKKGKDAKKAMKAMELTMDLFRELLEIKYQLQEMQAEQQKAKK